MKYTYNRLNKDIKNLVRRIRYAKFKPKTIVALARGGLIPGVWLSHILKAPLMIVSVKSYSEDRQQENTILLNSSYTVPIQSPILLIDEIADSGLTLKTVRKHFESIGIEVKTATLLYKKRSIIKPDWSMGEIKDDTWINFFWETNGGK
jgi:uncharacterized protein